jgi:polyvinyl alcohol dehydrogenase (cytochrome)
VWGSTPAIDAKRGAVYVATGNNYSLPAARSACVKNATTDAAKRACLPGDHFDAIVALDLKTGALKWSFEALPADAWNTDCGLPGIIPGDTNDPTNCPPGAGPDYDFGQGPMLFSARIGGKRVDLIGAGEKSGDFWALDRDTGANVWKTLVGPGGLTGGLQWGSATDGTRIYVAEANSTYLTGGWWSALDPATGAILWTTHDPGSGWTNVFGFFGFSAAGPVSTANGVVYACSLDPSGTMLAMDAASGAIRWTYSSGSSCLGGAAIADGTVYWGTGYRTFAPLTTAGDKLFAFAPA